MHRSGTSFVANWMQASGLYIGDRLAGATPSNVKGHFEDIDVLEFHERLLKANGTTMYMHEDRELTYTPVHMEEAKAMCAHRDEQHQEWGWKQPRAALFLDLWAEVLPDANYLIPVRHPLSIVNSIARREANKCLLRNDEIVGPKLHAKYLSDLKSHVARYDGMFIVHSRKLVDLLKGPKRDKKRVINFHKIRETSATLSHQLSDWGFQFKLIPYDELFEEQLLIHNTEFLVGPDEISAEAVDLFEELIG